MAERGRTALPALKASLTLRIPSTRSSLRLPAAVFLPGQRAAIGSRRLANLASARNQVISRANLATNGPFSRNEGLTSCSYTTARDVRPRQTIYALATGAGRAGVAIVRISGSECESVYHAMCLTSKRKPYACMPPGNRLVVRNIHHPVSSELLDSGAAVVYFPEGKSYTGEASLELHIHGGISTVSDVLDALGHCGKDVRPAQPGEFTRRAFENGRLDLTTSEALHSLILAETSMQRRVALQGAGGLQTARYEQLRQTLLEAMAMVEAIIDFGDEDGVESGTWEIAQRAAKDTLALIESELGIDRNDECTDGGISSSVQCDKVGAGCTTGRRHVGEILTNGIRLALYGPPNAGKSSLLNRLADRKAAIVSPIPGTTRDVLNVNLDIGGYKVVVFDTAGIRGSPSGHDPSAVVQIDEIEQMGIELAKEAVKEADLALLVVPAVAPDASGIAHNRQRPLRPDGYTDGAQRDPDLVFVNKTDLLSHNEPASIDASLCSGDSRVWLGSAMTGDGVDSLVEGLSTLIASKFAVAQSEPPLITQTRHRYHLHQCRSHLATFQALARPDDCDLDLVVAAEELRFAARSLGQVTGRDVSPDEILGSIFSTFCIGK
ncbi:P-loop containing nucleoside triphosphate hydrolase protein [Testicularia cyperi]|uniref:P-loop containing nucleoside triphosphate hydrolase protein n=1 Tax=Testicularia cyperi TaxID=1882483 RepID=A0A317XYI9_9BASI|nr:P-loop containing nucleoside triphosphate hydrolase protein [Testicularia cyperi]